MAVRCLFLAPDAAPPCQVLRQLRATLVPSTQRQLELRYCTSGAFIACPIFNRVERGLAEANRMRDDDPRDLWSDLAASA